jgi:hypothetical protein
VWVELDGTLREADLAEKLQDPRVLVLAAADALCRQGLAENRGDAHARIKGGIRVLEHELDVSVLASQGPAAEPRQLSALESDRARVQRLQAGDQPSEGRLTAP